VPGVARPALIAHAFAPVGAPAADAAAATAYLRKVWSAARSLGTTDTLLDGVPADLPDALPTADSPDFKLLAAATSARSDRVAQAFCFIRHDVIGIGVALASTAPRARLETWGAILRAWAAAGGDDAPPPQILGITRSFLAHVDGEPAQIPTTYGGDVIGALREAGLDAWMAPYRTADGFALWDWVDQRGARIVVAMSTRADEDDLSRWLWWQGDRELAPFGRYLLNASKLAYEARVYEATREGIVGRVRAVDGRIAELRRFDQGGRTTSTALQAVQQRLASAQGESADLAIELTRLRALQRTVGIARHNLGLTTPAPAQGQPSSAAQMFERDQALAGWLDNQIEHDTGYAQGAIERAREAQQLAQVRLQQQLAQLQRAQNRVALLQTSLVAALLASFTMINVFGIRLAPGDNLKLALLATGVSALLALPPLAVHWFERYGLIDHLAAMLCGAAAGWLVAAVLTGETAPLLALVTAAIGVAVARLLTREHDRRVAPEVPEISISNPGS
jgi:hypothetical protein